MPNSSENIKQPEAQQQNGQQFDPNQLVEALKQYNQAMNREPAPADEEYRIFADGKDDEGKAMAGRGFNRVVNPSYKLQEAVDAIRVRSVMYPRNVKDQIVKEWQGETGWSDELIEERYSRKATHAAVLPYIALELPAEWKADWLSSKEVDRMLEDFLLDT